MSQLDEDDFVRIHAAYQDFRRNNSFTAACAYLATLLPEEYDTAYDSWLLNQRSAEREAACPTIDVPTPGQYWTSISEKNYLDIDAVACLNSMMNRGVHPHIAVGHRKGVAFRLVPNTTQLVPTRNIDWDDEGHICPPMFLGINKNAVTDRPDMARHSLTQKSSKNGTSESATANDDTGFVFYQLGYLQYTLGLADNPTTMDLELAASKTWIDSESILVVKIGSAGNAESVYALYNYHPENEDGESYLVDEGIGGWWPSLPRDEHFPGGCIAENIMDLGPSHEIDLAIECGPHKIEEYHELVPCVRQEQPRCIVRQFVVSNEGQKAEDGKI